MHVTRRRRSCWSYSGVWCSVYVCARVWDLTYGLRRTRVVGFEQLTEAVCFDSHVGFFWGTQRRKVEGAWPACVWCWNCWNSNNVRLVISSRKKKGKSARYIKISKEVDGNVWNCHLWECVAYFCWLKYRFIHPLNGENHQFGPTLTSQTLVCIQTFTHVEVQDFAQGHFSR